MNKDLVKGELPPEQQQAALQAMKQIQDQMPFLIDLTIEDRRTLPKMGDKSRAFVDQGLLLATQNEGILPRNFDLGEYRRDVALVKQLEPVLMAMRQLTKRLEDTYLAVGSDAYAQSLVVYQAAKLAGKDGSLGEHLDSLGRRFAHKSAGPGNGGANSA
ncbi:hypothetical protein IVG45_01315 [Methylomonas sp. LL1]|uniref:hypothetical protein n=1 Tax=Methylomonas sp. LL1 TaxID=2785785 RepID=UPI0018C41DAA|nr:hypothetical protein [Methylomonas sp. LL1]QPK63650.1 hypothetical protein IVG45_01315 [Methylomonas sp. LL1]CAG0981773.1 hypothetical protein ANRL3_02179 [Anaerolineae bacterium]